MLFFGSNGTTEDTQSVCRITWCPNYCRHQLRQPFQGQLGLRLPRGSRLWLWQHFRFVRPEINGAGVPLELNYLLGKKNSKLELGFGASLGVYQVKETIGYVEDTWWYPGGENTDETSPKTYFYTSSRTQFGYFFFGDIGYRYQRPNGFMFRVGVSPSFNFGDKYGLSKAAFFPYIGFGWSF